MKNIKDVLMKLLVKYLMFVSIISNVYAMMPNSKITFDELGYTSKDTRLTLGGMPTCDEIYEDFISEMERSSEEFSSYEEFLAKSSYQQKIKILHLSCFAGNDIAKILTTITPLTRSILNTAWAIFVVERPVGEDQELAQEILAHGVDLDMQFDADLNNGQKRGKISLIEIAAAKSVISGYTGITSCLLDAGANPDRALEFCGEYFHKYRYGQEVKNLLLKYSKNYRASDYVDANSSAGSFPCAVSYPLILPAPPTRAIND